MNRKQLGVIISIVILLSGCDMNYEKLKKEYLSDFNIGKSETVRLEKSKYGSINGLPIEKEDIILAETILNIEDDFDSLKPALKNEIINLIVEKRLLAQDSISKLKEDSLFKTKLRQSKEELALNMWIEKETKKIADKVTESDIESFYNKNQELFLIPKQFKLRHIILKSKKEADKMMKKLKTKSKSKIFKTFISLAKTKSIDTSAENGGDLGWLTLDSLLPEVQDVIKSMTKGSVSMLDKKTDLGFHIFYLEDIQETMYMKLEAVKEDIKNILIKERIDQLIEKNLYNLKKSSKIELVDYNNSLVK